MLYISAMLYQTEVLLRLLLLVELHASGANEVS